MGEQARLATTDGWLVPDPDEFRYLMDHPPPRPGGYLKQFLVDARHWKPVAMWVVSAAVAGVGAATGNWVGVAGGVLGLAAYGRCLNLTVRSRRYSPVALGVIAGWDPPGRLGAFLTATARIPDGREVGVALHPQLADEVSRHDGPAEVLFLHSEWARYCSLIGVRPLPEPPEG